MSNDSSSSDGRAAQFAAWQQVEGVSAASWSNAVTEIELDLMERDVCRRIRERRQHLGLSQAELGERMSLGGFSMHQTTVGKVESGQRPLRLSELWAFALALEVPWLDLVGPPSEGGESDEGMRQIRRGRANRLVRAREAEEPTQSTERSLLEPVLGALRGDGAALGDDGTLKEATALELVRYLKQVADFGRTLTEREDAQASDADQ